MLRLCCGGNLKQREWLPSLLLRVNRDAEALDFVRTWTSLDASKGGRSIVGGGVRFFQTPISSVPLQEDHMNVLSRWATVPRLQLYYCTPEKSYWFAGEKKLYHVWLGGARSNKVSIIQRADQVPSRVILSSFLQCHLDTLLTELPVFSLLQTVCCDPSEPQLPVRGRSTNRLSIPGLWVRQSVFWHWTLQYRAYGEKSERSGGSVSAELASLHPEHR